MRIALIDGDIFVWESACQAEQRMTFGDQEVVHADEAMANANFDVKIRTIKEVCGADHVLIALSDPSRHYWRHDILPSYKAGRTGARPVALKGVRDHALKNHNCTARRALEADDVLGILATGKALAKMYKTKSVTPIVVTSDKDLKQIPGLHLNHQKISEGLFTVEKEDGEAWHLTQTLTGDVVDNYSGCPGIGPVKAAAIVPGGWPAIVKAFEKKGLTEDDALRQARVARILQVQDWNAKTQTPHLWVPKEHR